METAQVVPFTQEDAEFVGKFCDFLKLGLKVERIDTWNEPDDAIDLCEYVIIRDAEGKHNLYRITSTRGDLINPPDQIETHLGEYFTLNLALVGLAEAVVRDGASVFFEDQFHKSL